MINDLKTNLNDIKTKKPLVLCLTNTVSVELVANSLLAIGAAPIMSDCDDEIDELVNMASAIYINIGTLNHPFINLCRHALLLANRYQKPIVLDPVGAGATQVRTTIAKEFAPMAHIIKGNASEIMALTNHSEQTYGVEATHSTSDAKDVAIRLAKEYQNTLIVSGAIDLITNGQSTTKIPYGSPIMQQVTGMGCALGGIVAAFLAINPAHFQAAELATCFYGLCGHIAATHHKAPGSFKMAFIDELHSPNFNHMLKVLQS